jgi:hypothetical protein
LFSAYPEFLSVTFDPEGSYLDALGRIVLLQFFQSTGMTDCISNAMAITYLSIPASHPKIPGNRRR